MEIVMTKVRLLVIASLLLSGGMASATLDQVSRVLELDLTKVNVPAHEADTLLVRGCVTCEPLMLKVSSATIYRIGGFGAEPMELNSFRQSVRKLRRQEGASGLMLAVQYLPNNSRVTEITLVADQD